MEGKIIFITDGSPAAMAAGENALNIAKSQGFIIKAVVIIDEGWRYLLGDEWLNNSNTRHKFLNWFNQGLDLSAQEVLKRFCDQAKMLEIPTNAEIKVGKTDKVIIELANQPDTSLLILPHPLATLPAAEGGLKFNLNAIIKKTTCPVLIGVPK